MIVPLALFALLVPRDRQAGTVQLVARAGQTGAAVNGARVTFKAPPLTLAGRTMVPLQETLGLIGMGLAETPTGMTVGGLTFSKTFDQVSLNGQSVPAEGNLARPSGGLYISAKLLADGLRARLRSGNGGEFYLTLVRDTDDDPSLPIPRFVTDKEVYNVGEPVRVEEFSFHPLGEGVYLHWTNLRPAYFKPGPQIITLEATNAAGKGNHVSRTITITDRVQNTPLQFALRYASVGDALEDDSLRRPTLPRQEESRPGPRLLFSDSPEVVDRPGVTFRGECGGEARIVAYHLNALSGPARLCLAVRNLDPLPATVQVPRQGDTAPARIEGVLGQVTLLAYLTDHSNATLHLEPGETALLYLSPPLAPKSGASLMADLRTDRKLGIAVVMTEGTTPPDAATAYEMPLLGVDLNHVRGTFPSSVRQFTLDLAAGLPAKAVIGDPIGDPAEVGEEPDTKGRVVLDGNYGVSYVLTLRNAAGVVAAIAPRGGLYKGAVVVEDLDQGKREIVRLPRSGVLTDPGQPMIFLRSTAKNVRLEFIPASGSGLPVHLMFYR